MRIEDCQTGMRVVGNSQASKNYSITTEGVTGTIVKVYNKNEILISLDSTGKTYPVNCECFDLIDDVHSVSLIDYIMKGE